MTLKEIIETWDAESNAANDCIIEILESYIEFVDLVEQHDKLRNEKILLTLTKSRRQGWEPILQQAKAAKTKAHQ